MKIKKSLSFHSSTKISEKYYQSKVLPLSKVPLFTNIPDFYKKILLIL